MPRAVLFERIGGPEVLEVIDVPNAHPGLGEVRLAVRAAGLNPFDVKSRSGVVPGPPIDGPRGLGSDVAGVVDEVGEGAWYSDGSPIGVGDEVLGWGEHNSLREQLVLPAAQLTPKPATLSWEEAGSLMTAALTANAAIETLDIGTTDTVLLSAAAGSVGVIYAQLAIARGARVIGTASPPNHPRLRGLGVEPVEYGPGLVDRVRAIAPDGVSAVQDDFGRETIEAGLALGVAPERICTIVDHAAVRELGVVSPGRYVRSAATLGALAGRLAAGELRVFVARVFPLDRVREAFELLETRHVSGNIVLRP